MSGESGGKPPGVGAPISEPPGERGPEPEQAAGQPLELYGGGGCPYTAELREHLLWEAREFVEHDVESDAAAFARLLRLTGGRRGVPVLVEAGRVVQIGWQGRTCTVSGPPGSPASEGTEDAEGAGPPAPPGRHLP